MSLFVYPPAPWLWVSFYPEPIAQDKDFTLVTKMVDSVSLDVRLALSTSDAPDFNEFAFDINNNNCCEHFWNDQVLLTPPDYRAIINVPKNETLNITVQPNRPFIGLSNYKIVIFNGISKKSIPISRGILLEGKVKYEGKILTDG